MKITAQLPQEIPVAYSWCTGFTLKVEGKVTVKTSLTAQLNLKGCRGLSGPV